MLSLKWSKLIGAARKEDKDKASLEHHPYKPEQKSIFTITQKKSIYYMYW